MKTIKIIDLINNIANGKDAPKKIRYANLIWEYDDEIKDYIHDDLYLFYKINAMGLIKNYVEILEESKKIPEKITINENGTIGFSNGQWAARNMDKAFAMKINSIIDYLKSKGE